MRKQVKIKNEALSTITTVRLPLAVSGVIVSPNANIAAIDDVIREAAGCNPSNISNAYPVRVIEVIGIDITGIDLNTNNCNALYNVIDELNERAKV